MSHNIAILSFCPQHNVYLLRLHALQHLIDTIKSPSQCHKIAIEISRRVPENPGPVPVLSLISQSSVVGDMEQPAEIFITIANKITNTIGGSSSTNKSVSTSPWYC